MALRSVHAFRSQAAARNEQDGARRPATVTLSFSDTLVSQRRALDLLDRYDLPATFFVNSPRINQEGSLSSADLDRLVNELGGEVGGHTLTHTPLEGMSRARALREVCDDRANLIELGYQVTSFGYPKSGNDAAAMRVVKDCNYNNARETGSLGRAKAETIPPRDPFRIRLQSSIRNDDSLAEIKEAVLDAQDEGGWAIVSLHGVSEGRPVDTYEIRQSLLDQFLRWLKAEQDAGRVVVKTMHQVVGGEMKPPVRASEVPR
jgi:peptidoglycan/xylan/chitin deacetylase (PgdA/CDA1 family)